MNANAKKWVKALRSGKYKQASGALAKGLGNERAYCCLGVACDLYKAEYPTFRYSGKDGALPNQVRKWLGLAEDMGEYYEDGDSLSLAEKNDSGATFVQIAEVIEREPEHLFEGKS